MGRRLAARAADTTTGMTRYAILGNYILD